MLVRHINEIKVVLSPFNAASKSSRLFLNRVSTDKSRKANPNLKLVTNILTDTKAPSRIDVTYRDGKKLGLESDKLKIDNILDLINKHARKLEEIEQANNW
ncbi:hypothetical protein VTP01DRAFT_5146 [Rhizomucor pusillus]|uniref:mitochondrial 54S ribosomal protein mL53 n=1 Tax=Rhizomucor pusillus TaxID=4840 RepID=UPI003741FF92